MSTQFDTYTIPPIVGGVSGEAALDALNAPLQAAELALNSLSTRIGNITNKSATVRQYVPIASDVTLGMLVYYDTDSARFVPAIAKLLPSPGKQGESIEAPCSRVEGLIIGVDSSGTSGTMLCGGYYESSSVAEICLGLDAVAGTYYLSPTHKGRAVTDTRGHLRQPVLSYYGNGKINLNMFYMAHDNHFHSSAVLSDSWMPANAIGASITPPSGALFVYDIANLEGIGELSQDITVIVHKGLIVQDSSSLVISDGYLWCLLEAPPLAGDVMLFNHFPFAYNSAVVRSVVANGQAMSVKNKNGTVTLTLADYISGEVSNSSLAVSALAGNRILYTPVVTGVSSGPGVTVKRSFDGSVNISASNLVGRPVDAYSANHNGTTISSDGLFQYFTFPKSRSSEIVVSLPVQDVVPGGQMQATVWGCCAGVGAAFTANMYFVPQPTASTSSSIPTEPVTSQLGFAGIPGQLTYAETPQAIPFSGEGLLVAALRISSPPGTDIKLMRIGFKLNVVASSAQDSEEPVLEGVSAVTGSLSSGYSATKYDLVYVAGSSLGVCRCNTTVSGNRCVGIALADASVGEELPYLMSGIIQDPSFGFIVGLPVFVGLTGRLTQDVDLSNNPEAKYVQQVGIALTPAIVQIRIETAVMTGN